MKNFKYRVSIPYYNPATKNVKELARARVSARERGEELGSTEQFAQERCSSLTADGDVVLAFFNGEKGSERHILERVADLAVLGRPISAELQKISNLVLANALHNGKLPNKLSGRPPEELYALKSVERAYRYYEFLDKGVVDPESIVADQLHVSARKVELAAQKYKWLIGYEFEDRCKFRAQRAIDGEKKYTEGIILQLRQHDGLPLSGNCSVLTSSLEKASSLIAAIRLDWMERIESAQFEQPTLIEGDLEESQD